jgi:hypothetical protein
MPLCRCSRSSSARRRISSTRFPPSAWVLQLMGELMARRLLRLLSSSDSLATVSAIEPRPRIRVTWLGHCSGWHAKSLALLLLLGGGASVMLL